VKGDSEIIFAGAWRESMNCASERARRRSSLTNNKGRDIARPGELCELAEGRLKSGQRRMPTSLPRREIIVRDLQEGASSRLKKRLTALGQRGKESRSAGL